jgi:hypothetical protein
MNRVRPTKRACGNDFAIFRAWCAEQGLSALPADPAAVAAFIAAEAVRGVKCSTLGRRIAGIRYGHRLAGLAAVMRGARRTLGVAPVKKAAATSDKLLAMVAGGKTNLAGKRDRALLVTRRPSGHSSKVGNVEREQLGSPSGQCVAEQQQPVQDRPGRRRRGGRSLPRLDRLPGRCGKGVAGRRQHRRGAGFPAGRQGRPAASRAAAAAERRLDRQGLCQAPRARSQRVFRAQPPRRASSPPRPPWRFAVQDDGREPAQVGRHPARLCARRGRLPGSCWCGIAGFPNSPGDTVSAATGPPQ